VGGVSRRSIWYVIGSGVMIMLAVVGLLLLPIDQAGYRDIAVKSAQGSLAAVRTVALVGRASLAGKAFSPYTDVLLGDAREAVATSQQDLAGAEVPGNSSARLRDEVLPLLADSAAAVGDAGMVLGAGDDDALRAAVERLDRLGDQRQSFVDSHR